MVRAREQKARKANSTDVMSAAVNLAAGSRETEVKVMSDGQTQRKNKNQRRQTA